MDLKALRYYVATVESGSITAAAEQCHVAQPSISLAVSKLESGLGVTLLQRSQKGVCPTAEGQELYQKALHLLAESDALVRSFRQRQPLPVLAVSLNLVLSLKRMRQVLRSLNGLRDHYQLSLTRDDKDAMLLITDRHNVPEHFQFHSWWEDEYCLLLPLDHPLSLKPELSLQDLTGASVVERSFCEKSALWDQFVHHFGLQPRIVARTDSEEWALTLVESGLGICFAPAPEPGHLFQLKAVPLQNISGLERLSREIGLAVSPLVKTDILPRIGLL